MIEILLVVMAVTNIVAAALIWKLFRRPSHPPTSIDTSPILSVLNANSSKLSSDINHLPESLLLAITGSLNTHKGKLGELIGFISLKAEYDRIIPLGSIVDFIALDLPKDGSSGRMVFIDVKTGKNARLSPDQRALKKIIESGNISFIKLNVDSIDILGAQDDIVLSEVLSGEQGERKS